MSTKKAFIFTNGCPEMGIDTTKIQEFFQGNGWELVSKVSLADCIIFNTCALTQESENASIRIIKEIKKKKRKNTQFIVSGCLPKANRERLKNEHDGLIISNEEISRIDDLFRSVCSLQDFKANYLIKQTKYLGKLEWIFASLLTKRLYYTITKFLFSKFSKHSFIQDPLLSKNTYFIKISTGCLGACSFCAVKLSRGKLVSRPIEEVKKEFSEGLSKGYKEFSLIGTDTGCYGRDLGIDLMVLFRELLQHQGNYNIKIRNIEPKYLIEMLLRFIDILRTQKISYISSAVESGSIRILELMNRGYRIKDFVNAIAIIKKTSPKIKISTQIMVGFPGETEEDFKDTLDLIDKLDIDFFEIYLFQSRKGTPAAVMPGHLAEPVKEKRHFRLISKLISRGKTFLN